MSLIYITGLPGTGKSAICGELIERGFTAYDADEGGISQWYDRTTNEPVSEATVYTAPADKWFALYDFRLSRAAVEELVPKTETDIVFLCGAKPNEDEVRDLFDHVFYLSLGKDALKQRLAARTSNDFGKDPEQLNFIMGQRAAADAFHHAAGSILIDAAQSLPKVVDGILQKLR